MTIVEAAQKWRISQNWIRELIKSGRLDAKLDKGGPVAYYVIADGTPKPPSMQRSPQRKGSGRKIKPESMARRAYRAKQAKEAAKAPKSRKVKAPAKKTKKA